MLDLDHFPERIEYILNQYEITASALADRLEVQRSSISHLQSGRNKPSLEFLIKLMEEFSELRFEWLVYGEEPVTKKMIEEKSIKVESSSEGKQITTSPTSSPKEESEEAIDVHKKEKTLSETIQVQKPVTNPDKVIKRIILLYADGSFDAFNN